MRRVLSVFIAVCLVLSLFTGIFVSVPSARADTDVSAITVTGNTVVGATLTAAPTPSGATGTYQWKSSGSAD